MGTESSFQKMPGQTTRLTPTRLLAYLAGFVGVFLVAFAIMGTSSATHRRLAWTKVTNDPDRGTFWRAENGDTTFDDPNAEQDAQDAEPSAFQRMVNENRQRHWTKTHDPDFPSTVYWVADNGDRSYDNPMGERRRLQRDAENAQRQG